MLTRDFHFLCASVWLLCNFKFFYNYFYKPKQKYVDWTNEGKKGQSCRLLMPEECHSIFLNVIINIIHLDNQIIKGRLEPGKTKTNTEDNTQEFPAELKQRHIPGSKRLLRGLNITRCAQQKGSQTPLKGPLRKDRSEKALESMQRSPWGPPSPHPHISLRLNSLSENIFYTADIKRKRSLSRCAVPSPHMVLLWREALWGRVQIPQPQVRPLTTNSNKGMVGFRFPCSRGTLNNYDRLPAHANIQ